MIEEEKKEYDEVFDRFNPIGMERAFQHRRKMERKGKWENSPSQIYNIIDTMEVSGAQAIKRFWIFPEQRRNNIEDYIPIMEGASGGRESLKGSGVFLDPKTIDEVKYVDKFCRMRNSFGQYLHRALKSANDRLTVSEIADRLSEVTKQTEEIGIPIRMKEDHLRKYLEEAVNSGVLDVKPRSYRLTDSPGCPHCGGELPEGMRLPDYPYEEVMPDPDIFEQE